MKIENEIVNGRMTFIDIPDKEWNKRKELYDEICSHKVDVLYKEDDEYFQRDSICELICFPASLGGDARWMSNDVLTKVDSKYLRKALDEILKCEEESNG